MWKYILRLPLHRMLFRFATVENVKPLIYNKLAQRSFFMLNTAHILNLDQIEEDSQDKDIENVDYIEDLDLKCIQLSDEIKEACIKNDDAIRDLIKTLNMCIEEICEQYQHCIAKQVEITIKCMNLDPLNKHWDTLTRYRVEAEDLKLELEKYSLLVNRIGQMIYATAFNSLALGNETGTHVLTTDYDNLKDFMVQKYEENQSWDRKLIEVNKESILRGT